MAMPCISMNRVDREKKKRGLKVDEHNYAADEKEEEVEAESALLLEISEQMFSVIRSSIRDEIYLE
jgi:hypothetical protein